MIFRIPLIRRCLYTGNEKVLFINLKHCVAGASSSVALSRHAVDSSSRSTIAIVAKGRIFECPKSCSMWSMVDGQKS
jgi:hypothetical protein